MGRRMTDNAAEAKVHDAEEAAEEGRSANQYAEDMKKPLADRMKLTQKGFLKED
jgi:hypothetical protein